MRVVQIRVSRATFADTMVTMHDWLDRNGDRSVRFDTVFDDDGISFSLEFVADEQAEAFQHQFGGAAPKQGDTEPRSSGGETLTSLLPRGVVHAVPLLDVVASSAWSEAIYRGFEVTLAPVVAHFSI